MKNLTKFQTLFIIIALAIVAAFTDLSLAKLYNTNQQKHLYPLSTTVTKIENDTVTVEDSNGNLWDFYGVEDWQVGDGCSLLMDNNGTENIEDDIIISTQYHTTNWDTEYMYSNLEIVDWNTDGEELAFALSDGTELYAYKTENVYNK